MRYLVQLKLLIWKNWILRKRNKIRTAIEFLWPIVIFLFLILLHNLGVRKNISDCYFKPKAMPSTGELLFIQTLICSFNNTCDKYENSTMEEYNQSLLSRLGLALQEDFDLLEKNEGPFGRGSASEMYRKSGGRRNVRSGEFLQDFSRFRCSDRDDESLRRDIFVLACVTDVIESRTPRSDFTRTIRNPFFIKTKRDPRICRRNAQYAGKSKELEIISNGKRALMVRALLFQPVVQHQQADNQTANAAESIDYSKILDSIFCGPRVPPLSDQIRSVLSERSFSKKYLLKESYPHTQSTDTNWEDDTTDFCNDLMKKLSSNESSKIIFGLLKPYFRGKILYTPDAPVINTLMSRINETLNKIKHVRDLLADLAEANRTEDISLYEILMKYKNDRKFLKTVVGKDVGKEFLKYYGKKGVGKNIEADADAFAHVIEESAQHLRHSMSDSKRIFAFRQLKSYLECIDFNRIIPVANEEEAVAQSLKWLKNDRLTALVVFQNISRDEEKLPPSLTYKIRTGIDRTPKTTQIRDRVYVTGVKRNVFQDLKHITGGFSFLQNLIETELIKEYTGRKKTPGIYLQQMPFPCHVHDSFMHVITRTLPVFMVISWCYTFGMTVKKIVAEKENHVKGTMRIFGVYSSQHWIAWFLDAYLPLLIISLILSSMLTFGNVVPNSDFFLIWLFIVTFALPTISFAFLLSIFFTKSSFALNVSMVIFFLMYLIYPPIQNFGEAIDSSLKSIACTLSNVAFGLGCTWIANMEEIGLGARFTHIHYSPIPGNPITMAFVLQMFLLDSATYLLLALYLENVYRAEESVRLPWNYMFTSAYWKNIPKKKGIPNPHKYHIGMDETRFEAEPEDLPVGIEVVNLTKEYGKGGGRRRVVNNLSMKFYENQITSFLGHNGAGKTTSISMMSGLLPITSGIVLIYGVNLEKDPEIAGKDIGICRQENVFFDDLTVEEHLWLFSRLKNRTPEETKKDSEKIMRDLQLEHRAKIPVRNLSGGMKRKVCLAMAFIGGPRTIFLDEPTAGVDPFSRRSIWNLLIKYKGGKIPLYPRPVFLFKGKSGRPSKIMGLIVPFCGGCSKMKKKLNLSGGWHTAEGNGQYRVPSKSEFEINKYKTWELCDFPGILGRTIILTTHFLDEADLLGDRIAIIGNGELQCCGSSVFLKNKFGRGYYLTIESAISSGKKIYGRDNKASESYLSPQAAELYALITGIIADAKFLEEIGTEITFVLPFRTDPGAYDELFKTLSNNKNNLNILSYGISNTSLSEVFFTITRQTETEEEDSSIDGLSTSSPHQEKSAETATMSGCRKIVSGKLMEPGIAERALDSRIGKVVTQQFFALLVKRFHHHRRNYKLLIIEILLPAVFMAIALTLVLTLPAIEVMPALKIDVSAYSPSVIFYKNNLPSDPVIDSYEKSLLSPSGLGTKCVELWEFGTTTSTRTVDLLALSKSGMSRLLQGMVLTVRIALSHRGFSFQHIGRGVFAVGLLLSYLILVVDYLGQLIVPVPIISLGTPEKCSMHTISGKYTAKAGKVEMTKNCSCDNGIYTCQANENYVEPPYSRMSSGDVLFNLSSFDLVNWLITSELNMSHVRYGGMEFGYYNVWSGIRIDEFFNLFMINNFISLMLQVPKGRDSPFDVDILSNFLISFSYNKTYGAEILKSMNPWDNIIIWYNNRGWIAGMAFMNGVSNLVLRALLPREKDASKYGITLLNHPLPITERQLEDDIEIQINTSLLTAIAIIWALSFIPAMFAIYIVEERISGLKLLQIVSGIGKSIYWIVALFWDMMLYSVNVLTIITLFIAFDVRTYINEESFTAFVLLLYAYGFANITFVYSVSYMFVTPSIAFIFVACYNIFVGMITLWTTFFLDLISYSDDPLYLKKIFLVFPPFCFGRGLVKMALTYNSAQIMRTFGLKSRIDYAAWSITSKYMVVMVCLGIIFFATTILIQFRIFPNSRAFGNIDRERRDSEKDEEEDVKKERLRVDSGAARETGDVLIISNLTKYYPNAKTLAVDHISFGVKNGECFGLLGMNGAGKTTVFKMLTGYLPISDGDAWIGGHSLRKNVRKARSLIGYCPQGDALDPYLTCEEHLSLFSRIRGITGRKKEEAIDLNIHRLGLTPHRHKIVKVLSGGYKRKLNMAIALVGDPELVLLDEPTSGMDSQSRRFVWKCIQRIVSEGRCVVLTSHNMEECQALCTKLSIMVRGILMCFGSCQHLKTKFDDAYNVRIRIANAKETGNVKQYVQEKLPNCSLIYTHCLEMRFRLHAPTHLGLAFSVLNQAKSENLIHDYSLSQSTLENVFLQLAGSSEYAVVPSRFRYIESFCCGRYFKKNEKTGKKPRNRIYFQRIRQNQ